MPAAGPSAGQLAHLCASYALCCSGLWPTSKTAVMIECICGACRGVFLGPLIALLLILTLTAMSRRHHQLTWWYPILALALFIVCRAAGVVDSCSNKEFWDKINECSAGIIDCFKCNVCVQAIVYVACCESPDVHVLLLSSHIQQSHHLLRMTAYTII